MKNIMVFCIPAHGHHNPTFPVVAQLAARGNAVRYYSFDEFREKIEATGAEFISCDRFLPELSAEEEAALKAVSTTEMTIQDLRTTGMMDDFLAEQVESFKPDVIYTDSVCFWGKLTARKYNIPMVVSTTTFAFNKQSSGYMKNSFSEVMDVMKGSGRVKKELKALEQYGYHEKSIMPLVRNDNYTDTVVYATEKYQPFSYTFSKHYAFVGPSVFTDKKPDKTGARPLVYISLGTVINERPDFYKDCIKALGNEQVDVIISCGKYLDIDTLGELPENIKVYPQVDQLDILSRASAFITHCGMNSVSESLYMGTPMVLFPQTSEQRAVARRANEMGAGIILKNDDAESIRTAVLSVINDKTYSEKAMECCEDFRSAKGAEGAAEFIENAPHIMPEEDKRSIMKDVLPGLLQLIFWLVVTAGIIVFRSITGSNLWWIFIVAANIVIIPYKKITDRLIWKGAKK